MKIKITPQIESEVARLRSEQELERRIASGLNNYVDFNAVSMDSGGVTADSPQAQAGQLIADTACVIAEANNVFYNPQQQDMVHAILAHEGRVFSAQQYRENPYLQRISFADKALGRFSLSFGLFESFQLMNYDTPRRTKGRYFAAPALACFDDDFPFPCFMEGNSAWMSITPNEMFTMEKPLREAKGRVLTLGCGMGYYAYMAHLKENVESVTIVELEPDVVELFQSVILPQFDHPEKITLVQGDANVFMAELEDGVYDYCFADTWIGADSVSQYLQMRDACKHLKRTRVSYWIERSFLNGLLRLVALEICEAYDRACGRTPQPRRISPTLEEAQSYVHRLVDDAMITTPAAIQRLMDQDNLLKLMTATDVRFKN